MILLVKSVRLRLYFSCLSWVLMRPQRWLTLCSSVQYQKDILIQSTKVETHEHEQKPQSNASPRSFLRWRWKWTAPATPRLWWAYVWEQVVTTRPSRAKNGIKNTAAMSVWPHTAGVQCFTLACFPSPTRCSSWALFVSFRDVFEAWCSIRNQTMGTVK